jgi:hypothetical protein
MTKNNSQAEYDAIQKLVKVTNELKAKERAKQAMAAFGGQ